MSAVRETSRYFQNKRMSTQDPAKAGFYVFCLHHKDKSLTICVVLDGGFLNQLDTGLSTLHPSINEIVRVFLWLAAALIDICFGARPRWPYEYVRKRPYDSADWRLVGFFVMMLYVMAVHILEQVPLAPFTTMHVGGEASFFTRVGNIEELSESVFFARAKNLLIFVLGAGSNTLVSESGFPGLVIKIEFNGIVCENNRVTAGAGVVWDELVRDVVSRSLWGIENLSLVPGSVGGAAVQNIGAYGMEACESIFSVDAFDTETMQIKTFLRKECEFGYRESIFKKNKNLIVVNVSFDLIQNGTSHTEYEDVKKYFDGKKILAPSLVEIREAIVSIRTAKMPAPGTGTAGSFFKNPLVEIDHYEDLKIIFPGLKAYPQGDNTVKLSAAWLLDHVGNWRGVRRGDAGVHERQALILVNHGTASSKEILSLADEMKHDIKEKTGVLLEEEVVII